MDLQTIALVGEGAAQVKQPNQELERKERHTGQHKVFNKRPEFKDII